MYSREFKITLTVSIPLSSDYKCTEDQAETLVQSSLHDAGIESNIIDIDKVPIEYVHKDYYGDDYDIEDDPEDITKFEGPTGYIAPDGKFYGGNSAYDSFMHIMMAQEVYDSYKDKIDTSICRRSSGGIDYDLERWGFIKVRDSDICYYVPYEKEGKIVYWTDEQRATVLRYMKHYEKLTYDQVGRAYQIRFRDACGHTTPVSASKFAQMDKFAIIKCFDFTHRLG